jgi:hypothetical protein
MMKKNATMTARPDEMITKLVKKDSAMKRENGLTPEALLFAMKGGNGGGNCGKAGKGGRCPKREKRDNKGENERKGKDCQKWFHRQWRGHTTKNRLRKQRSDPPKFAETAVKASPETTSIQNCWMVASSNASSSDWFSH